MVFYIAIICRWKLRYDRPPLTTLFNGLVRRSMMICNPLERDECRCYCSSSGCLPLHKIWKCNEAWRYHEGCKSSTKKALYDAMAQWIYWGGLNEAQSQLCHRAFVQSEVFDRLGMAHTCCKFNMSARRSSMHPEDQRQIQDEDMELKQQLDLMVEAYEGYLDRHAGDVRSFWDSWWQKLDEILPELMPKERCRRRCLTYWDYQAYKGSATYAQEEAQLQQDRAKVEKDALAKKGYTGGGFIDVIRNHFADVLDVELSETRSSSGFRPLLRRSHEVETDRKVVVKTAPKHLFCRERQILTRFQAIPTLRQLIDEVQEPPLLVLEHLDRDAFYESGLKEFKSAEIKQVARAVLQALAALHEDGLVHTDIKPDNILVNYGSNGVRFSDVKLADCGDVVHIDSILEDQLPGAAIFRSPEAMLQIGWGTATDIWSLGATLISLLWGHHRHIFKPDRIDPHDDIFLCEVIKRMYQFFGPFPRSYETLCDAERLEVITLIANTTPRLTPFCMTGPPEISVEDRDFICKLMRLDPRDRPTAQELLQDPWLTEKSARSTSLVWKATSPPMSLERSFAGSS
ncbi:MAG: hypothetical protein Q9208_001104 [Pyrenodesmia sp. 3 TL-2023]